MRRLLAIALLTVPTAAMAQEGARDMPAQTARFWIAQLRDHYRTTPLRERITITVDADPDRGREFLTFASQPLDGFREPEVFVDLGRVEIWTRPPGDDEQGPGKVRMAHEFDMRHYYEVPTSEGATTAQTWREALPPLIVPQLALSLGGPLFPELGEVTWTDATEHARGADARTLELEGTLGAGTVRMTIEADATPRVLETVIEAEPGPVTITCETEILPPVEGRLGYDIARRERLDSMSDLRARPGDVRAGDTLPDLPLVYFTLGDDVPVEAYRQRLMLFFDGHRATEAGLPDDASAALDALRQAAEEVGPTTRIDPIGVIDPLRVAGNLQTAEIRMMEAVEPEAVWYTLSDTHTIRRFSAESDLAIVVASKDGYVAGVIDLGDLAQRLNEEGRDEVVASLAREVERLCRLITRRERGLDD